MKFTIITHAEHKIKEHEIYAYAPYVREMNLWLKYVDEVEIVAPISTEEVTSIESTYLFKNHHSVLDTESHDLKTVKHIATQETPCLPDRQARNNEIKLIKIPEFDITSLKNGIKAIFKIPKILWVIYKAMNRADHIHLRCPGNIGLLACIAQIGFPSKPKTIKYAGNWDPNSKQPWSYKLQKWILSNTFLTKNAKVLVYGKWSNQTKNIIPFFTASYLEKEIEQVDLEVKGKSLRQACTEQSRSAQTNNTKRHSEPSCLAGRQDEAISSKVQITSSQTPRNDEIERHPELVSGSHSNALNFIFVGALTKGKQPLLSVQVVHKLKKRGYRIQLNIYGDGKERIPIEKYIEENNLQNEVILHGNTSKEMVKDAYKKAHFLVFISKSEGWPKVVAEAMFWGCLPISSHVSCIPYMLDDGNRGAIVNPNINEIVSVVENYISNDKKYQLQVEKAKNWSRQFTLEKFEKEIGELF